MPLRLEVSPAYLKLVFVFKAGIFGLASALIGSAPESAELTSSRSRPAVGVWNSSGSLGIDSLSDWKSGLLKESLLAATPGSGLKLSFAISLVLWLLKV